MRPLEELIVRANEQSREAAKRDVLQKLWGVSTAHINAVNRLIQRVEGLTPDEIDGIAVYHPPVAR